MKIAPRFLVPSIISEYDSEYPWEERIEGSVLFADVSGFTPMSEALSVLGAEGSEILTEILNLYFDEMIEIIHGAGGHVMKFGGDAILCFFPGSESLASCLSSAWSMQQSMDKFQAIKTPVRVFALQMKIGVSFGEILLAGVGDPTVRCDYVFAGSPVDLTSDAEHHAHAGEIVVHLPQGPHGYGEFTFKPLTENFYALKSAPLHTPTAVKPQLASQNLSHYVIQEIHDMVVSGYDSYIGTLQSSVPVFIQFTGFTYDRKSFKLEEFHEFFSTIMRITHNYSGRLNRISMGDKGSTFFILFGSPRSLEKKEELASVWSLELKNEIKIRFPYVSLRIGMNTGRLFSGLVGGSQRFDYTVMGDAVNLSARVMQGTEAFQIHVTDAFHARCSNAIHFKPMGPKKFKGKKKAINIFEVADKKVKERTRNSDATLIGRASQLKKITTILKNCIRGSPTFTVIQGPAGMGKSYLAHYILEHRCKDFFIVRGQGDITRKNHLYAPWKECLIHLFFNGQKPTLEMLEDFLSSSLDSYKDYLTWYAEFFEVFYSSGAKSYDEKTRKKLFHHQLCNLILQHCTESPLLIFLEDLHWFDSLTIELLQSLIDHINDQKISIMAVTRPGWQDTNLKEYAILRIIEIDEFSRDSVTALAEQYFSGPVTNDLVDSMIQHSGGNPFYSIKFLEYLETNSMVHTYLGKWTMIKGTKISKTLRGDDIIITQVESLPLNEQIHLRFTACEGSTFSFRVLNKAMGSHFSLDTWESLSTKGYFQHVSDDIYTYNHALVQSIIYQTIPQKLRKRIHRKIGNSIEITHEHERHKWFPNLANHFFLASHRNKALHYSIAAGDQLFKELSYIEAVNFLKRAFGMLKYTSDNQKWRICYDLAESLFVLKNNEDAIELIQKISNAAKRNNRINFYLRAKNLEFDIKSTISDFSYVSQVKRLLKSTIGLTESEIVKFNLALGTAYFRKGEIQDAEKYLSNVVQSEKFNELIERTMPAYLYLATIARRKGQYDEALMILDNALQKLRSNNMPFKELGFEIEKATIHHWKGNLEKARDVYLMLHEKCETIGDIYYSTTVLLNLGLTYVEMGNLDDAEMYLTEALKVFIKMGVKNGAALAMNHLGILQFYKQDYEKAYTFYSDALNQLEQSRELTELADVYYNLSEVSLYRKKYDDAVKWFLELEKVVDKLGDPRLQQAKQELKASIDAAV